MAVIARSVLGQKPRLWVASAAMDLSVPAVAAASSASSSSAPAPPPFSLESVAAAMAEEDALRESLIKRSRDVQKLSKGAIYSLHRGEVARATAQLAEARGIAEADLLPVVAPARHPVLRGGAVTSSLEEWAEGFIFARFLEAGSAPTYEDVAAVLPVNRDEYLGGLMDFIGELGRVAVLAATRRDLAHVKTCLRVCTEVHGALFVFDFRNGGLRRKFDATKYTLKKLEQVVYELTLATSFAFVPKGAADADGPPAPSGDADGDSGGGCGEDDNLGAAGAEHDEEGGRGGRGGFRGGRGGAKRGRLQ